MKLRKEKIFRRIIKRHKAEPYTSKYYGVCYNKAVKKFHVQLHYNGENHTVGFFDSEIDAAKAFDRELLLHNGNRCYLNFPNE
ncbi:MAG: hypothetical protein AABY22_04070 [Nanoarchaeota archaeon]